MTDAQIIVVAPTGRDGELICNLLKRVGMEAVECPDCDAACIEAANGVGTLVIADEALSTSCIETLVKFISAQPSWSDLPIVVLSRCGEVSMVSEARRRMREPLGNVVLVERPVRPETLISVLETTVRARRRQYDVRSYVQREARAAEALKKAEKLALAGRLSASIAHEINNPLEAVVNLHHLMSRAATLEEAKGYLVIADLELDRVSEISRQTLRFHRGNAKPAEVKIPEVLDSVLKLYELRLASKKIVVDRRFDDAAVVSGFDGELRQVVANLIGNSVDAMYGGGRLRLRVAPGCERSNGQRRGIRVVVADTGKGIPDKVRSTLFEPFISTKGNTGTGLGLWVTSEIVRKHGGTLRYKSRLGSGTVFSIFLPSEIPSANAA